MSALVVPIFFGCIRCYVFFVTLGLSRGTIRHSHLLCLSLALALVLAFPGTAPTLIAELSLAKFAVILAVEVWYGFILAVPASLAIQSIPAAGKCADLLRGLQLADLWFPGQGGHVSPLEQMLLLFVPAVLFSSHLIERLIKPVLSLPLAICEVLTPFKFCPSTDLLEHLITASWDALAGSILAITPVLVLVVILDIGIALLSRLVHPLNVTFEFLPAKLLAGLFVVVLCASGEPEFFNALLQRAVAVERIISTALAP